MEEVEESGETGKTYTNLVHHSDACILCGLIKLEHGRGDIARSHHMLLIANRRFNDGCVVSVRNQADDKIMLGHRSVKSLVIVNV